MADTISTRPTKRRQTADEDIIQQAVDAAGAPENAPAEGAGDGLGNSFSETGQGLLVAQKALTEEDARQALATLKRYKEGKANLENRVIEDERWYQLRHWEYMRRRQANDPAHPQPTPTSAWLFNSIAAKHADAMDNYPEPNVLPREQGDEQDAKLLSAVLPVVLERGEFEDVYSRNWWEKLKHGTAVYGVFWDSSISNGIGDIVVKDIDLLNIFWEPGITDIQNSRNVFVVSLQDTDIVKATYPDLEEKLTGRANITTAEYIHDDSVDNSGKTPIVDWYYKVSNGAGKSVLHYAKIVGGTIVFASQNQPEYAENGWYDHGLYPFVFDVLYPEKGTPCGFGYVAICKDPQLYIDKLSANIMETSMMGSKVRYLVSDDTNINEDELKDWNNPVIHVSGRLDDTRLQQIKPQPLDPIYVNVMQQKIDEMKETSANRDISNGGTASGATAAAAIAALQEAGNKLSRDMISASYRKYTAVGYLCIELIRQFYSDTRMFRITGEDGDYQFQPYNNANIAGQITGVDAQGNDLIRKPVFDIKIRAQKRSPFAREAQNQRAMELYSAGFFAPENAQAALVCLEMMEFEGIEKVRTQVSQGQTLLNELQNMQMQMAQMMEAIGIGQAAAEGAPATGGNTGTTGGGRSMGSKILADQSDSAEMTNYGKRLAENAIPDVSKQAGVSV